MDDGGNDNVRANSPKLEPDCWGSLVERLPTHGGHWQDPRPLPAAALLDDELHPGPIPLRKVIDRTPGFHAYPLWDWYRDV